MAKKGKLKIVNARAKILYLENTMKTKPEVNCFRSPASDVLAGGKPVPAVAPAKYRKFKPKQPTAKGTEVLPCAVIMPHLVDVRYDPKHYNGRGGWRVELQYPGKRETDVISLTNEQAGNEWEACNVAAKTLIALEQYPDRAFEALNQMAKGKAPKPQATAKGEEVCKGKVLRQVEGLREGVDGFHVVIPGEEHGEKPITTGPFATKKEAQRFMDAEVGAPNAQIVEVRNGKPAGANAKEVFSLLLTC
jgi:hypothetical protein